MRYFFTTFVWAACIAAAPTGAQATGLGMLIEAALAYHPTARAQQDIHAAAQSGVEQARWQYYPTPSVSVENARTSTTDTAYAGDKTVSILRLQQPLWTGGRISAGVDKAQAQSAIAEAGRDEVQQQLAVRVVQTYGDWLAGALKVRAHEQNLATHVRLQELVTRRIAQGASADSDLVLAVARHQAVAADLAAAQAQQSTALARLRQLTGRTLSEDTLDALSLQLPASVQDTDTLLRLAFDMSPALRKTQAQAQLQLASVAERKSEQSSEVYVRAERQFGNFALEHAPPENRVFIGLTSRFGAGLSTLSSAKGAQSLYNAALDDVEAQKISISDQVQADHTAMQSTMARLQALQASLTAAAQVAESYDRQFLAGRKSWLDVMNAARELAQTQIQVADLRATQLTLAWRIALYTRSLASLVEPRTE